MYMYCHTLMEEEGRRNEVDDCLMEQVGNELWYVQAVRGTSDS